MLLNSKPRNDPHHVKLAANYRQAIDYIAKHAKNNAIKTRNITP